MSKAELRPLNLAGFNSRNVAVPLFQHFRMEPETVKDFESKVAPDEKVYPYYPIYQFKDKGVIKDNFSSAFGCFRKIWRTCFGNSVEGDPGGYFVRSQKPGEVLKSMRTVENGFGLANYAHQLFSRELNGEPYIEHTLWATDYYSRKYKPPAWVLAGTLLHDSVEESQKEVEYEGRMIPNPFVVTLEDVRNFVGERAAKFVDTVTSVRQLKQKAGSTEVEDVKNMTETIFKFIDALKSGEDGVAAVVGKIIEKMHNIRTLSAKPPDEQVSTAINTFEVYVTLANRLGMKEEARWLADECFKYMEPELAGEIESKSKEYLDQTDERLREMETYTAEMMKDRGIGIVKVKLRKPGIYDIASRLGERRTTDQSDYYLEADIVLKDHLKEDDKSDLGKERVFFARAINAVSTLDTVSRRYIIPRMAGDPAHSSGLNEARSIIDDVASREIPDLASFRLYYLENPSNPRGRKIPVKIHVLKESEYRLETTPLTYLHAVELTDEDIRRGEYSLHQRRVWAREAYVRLNRELTVLTGDPDMARDKILRRMFLTLPSAQFITMEKREGRDGRITDTHETVIARNATVLDYIMSRIENSWQRVNAVYLNGEKITDLRTVLGRVLLPNDRIGVTFGENDENNADVYWLNAVCIDKETVTKQIAEKLEAKIAGLRATAATSESPAMRQLAGEEITRMVGELRDRGWRKINTKVENLDDIGLGWGSEAFPDPGMNPRDFAYMVGLEKIDEETINRVAGRLNEFWNGLTVVLVQMENVAGQLAEASDVFKNYGLNIIHEAMTSKWGNTTRVPYRISPADPNIGHLQEAIKEIEGRLGEDQSVKFTVTIFRNNAEYIRWQNRYVHEK